jgi:hypothetical protein
MEDAQNCLIWRTKKTRLWHHNSVIMNSYAYTMNILLVLIKTNIEG